jgi:hypothetical protein
MSRVADSQPYPCPYCRRSFANTDTIIGHCGRDHHPDLNNAIAVWGVQCPECGDGTQRLAYHSTRTHRRPLPLLFADAKRAGDPHKVIERLMLHYVDLFLEERGVQQ